MAKLEAVNLKQQYLYGTTGVNDLSFTVEDDSYVILGGEESGKTSLMHVLSGKEPPFSGDAFYDGVPLHQIPDAERSIVYVRERGGAFRFRSVFYNCAYPLKLRKVPDSEIRDRVAYALDAVGLTGAERCCAGKLPPLGAAKLRLARCFLRKADYYLIDCVQKGLCEDDRRAILDTLFAVKKLPGVKIFATDRYGEAVCLGDHGAVLYYGITEQTGNTRGFFRNPETPEVLRLTHGEPSIEEGNLKACSCEILTRTKKIRLDPEKLKPDVFAESESRDGLLPVLVATAPDGVAKIYSAKDEKLIYFD